MDTESTNQPAVLVAHCDNYREDVDAPCTGEIRFRWGMSQSDPCDVCGSRCGVAVAAWERVEPADPSPASPGTLAIVRDLVTTLDEFVEEHSDPGTRALGVLSEARRFISTGGTGHVEDSPEVDAIAETINAVVGMSVPFPKLMAAARGVEKLIEARRAGAVPDTGQTREQIARRDITFGEYVIAVCDAIGLPHDSPRAAVVEAIRAAVAGAQALESPTDSTPKSGRGGSGEAETASGGRVPDVAAFASEMVARISMAPSKPLLPWPELPQDLAFLAAVIDRLRAGAQIMAAELTLQGVDQAAADDIRRRAGLLGADTIPDRLTWISEAGETAAAERQARYQETACARRPAEERPDA